MKVTAIETINLDEFPNLLWVHVHTDEGIVGLGETFYAVEPAIAHIHQTIAPYLLGKNPLTIDAHSRHMLYNYLGFKSVGAEMRAASAVDIAFGILVLLTRRPAWAWSVQIAVVLVYSAIITWRLPALWLEPFGPVAKNLPILALLLLL